jgi:hypothetical protein
VEAALTTARPHLHGRLVHAVEQRLVVDAASREAAGAAVLIVHRWRVDGDRVE